MDEALQLTVTATPHTAVAVTALRQGRALLPCGGSVCRALDATDPAGELETDAYGEAVDALDVAARVFGHDSAADVGAHDADAALLFDIAVYHLTGSPADVPAALAAFRRAAGPPLPGVL
jgi:hypothetical protein